MRLGISSVGRGVHAKRRFVFADHGSSVLHQCPWPGAILRRKGLYSSHLTKWRKQRRDGTLKALDKKRGKQGKSESEAELAKLRRDNARFVRELEKAEVIIGTQKKLAEKSVENTPWRRCACPLSF